MRGKRRRSSRVIEREPKRQKVADVSYTTVQRTVHSRGLHAFKQRKTSRLSKAHKRGRLKFARTNIRKNWSNVVFSDEHRCETIQRRQPTTQLCLGQICERSSWEGDGAVGVDG